MDIVLNTDSALITHEDGTASTAVVTFSSVGHSSQKTQNPEFVKTLQNVAANPHTFHVMDTRRSWYNDTASSIVDALQPKLLPFSKTVTLGSSMGGFGALYFASQLPHCRRAIAFAPQFSLSPKFMPMLDTRWVGFARRISNHVLDHALVEANQSVDYVIFYGADNVEDTLHAQRFMKFINLPLTIFFVEACGHDVAHFIRDKGALPKLVEHLIAGSAMPEAIQDILSAHGVATGYWQSPAVGNV